MWCASQQYCQFVFLLLLLLLFLLFVWQCSWNMMSVHFARLIVIEWREKKNKTETSKTRNLPKCWTQHITSILSVENQVNCICLANEDATLRSYYYLSLNSIQHICVLWKVHIFLTSYFTSYDFILCLLLCIVMKFELFVFATSWITSCIHRLAITIFFVMFFFCCSFGISCICKFVRNKTE